MAKPTEEMDDRELHQLRAVARARHINPEHMTKAELGHLLALEGNQNSAADDAAAAEQVERAKRLAAVMSMHGIWKDDPTKPQDGVEYQREVRAEWR